MNLNISRVLHAGYVFDCDQTRIIFDPIFENPFSRNCYAYPDVRFNIEEIKKQKFDAVFISHYHDDHCSLESLDLLDRNTPIYIYCLFEELFSLIQELGFNHVYPLKIDTSLSIGSFEIIPRKALDEDVDSIFEIKAAGLKILNVVDSWIDPSTLNQLALSAPWDMILWPFQTMREIEVLSPSKASPASLELPPEWIEQLKLLNPKYIVPSSCQFVLESWSWYNNSFFPISYQQFKNEVELNLPHTQVVRLNPSMSISLNKNFVHTSSALPWIQPIGNQDVEYVYKSNLIIPKISEISKNFPAISSEKNEIVFTYCRIGLIEKYNSLDEPLDPYLKKPTLWHLSVYNHEGIATNFFYKIDNRHINLIERLDEPATWTTEVPLTKLYAALEDGESLTSMYVRINDNVTNSQIESADVMEDPLIRCLFTGAFGSYQKAQLKRLKSLKKQVRRLSPV